MVYWGLCTLVGDSIQPCFCVTSNLFLKLPHSREAGSDSVRECAERLLDNLIFYSDGPDDNCFLPHPRFVPGSAEARPTGARCGHWRLTSP